MSVFDVFFFFFFFQAEDGIRDLTVTGVQTCALPISLERPGPGNCLHEHRSRRPSLRAAPRARERAVTQGALRAAPSRTCPSASAAPRPVQPLEGGASQL